jgi:hypothetical protein
MGERTCLLHAARRSSNRTTLKAEINGEPMTFNSQAEAQAAE